MEVAASVAGLITLADAIFRAAFQYAKSAKNAKQEALDLAGEAQDLAGVLHRLSLLASAFETDPESSQQQTLRLHHIQSCRRILLRAEKALSKATSDFDAGKARTVKRALMWPFSSAEVKELVGDMGRHKATLSLALTADTMDALMRSLTLQDKNNGRLAALGCGIRETLEIVTNIQLNDQRRSVLESFMVTNPQQSLAQCLGLRHPETGLWLLEGDEFQSWTTEANSKLWLSGIPGAGKTILAGSIISEVLALSSKATGVAFFFCEYKRKETQQPINLVQTMAAQLARQNTKAYEILEEYHQELHPSQGLSSAPSLWRMRQVLQQMIACFGTVYMVIDGLDECDEFAREVAILLAETADDEVNLSVAILSRDELVIRETLADSFVHVDIEAQRDDVRLYVASELELRTRRGQLRLKTVGLKDEILRVLVDENGGMFRWVACQLDYLCELPRDKDRRDALKSLPPTLNGTYQRILERIDTKGEGVRRLVERCLSFISVAVPQMTMDELREAVSIEEDTEALDEESLVDEAAILLHCSSLVRRCKVPGSETSYIEFSHFSVIEYLQGPFLTGTNLERYQLSYAASTKNLAISCLRMVNLHGFRLTATRDDTQHLKQRHRLHPFYGYAAVSWACFSDTHWDDATISTLAKKLFSSEKHNAFLSWALELCFICLRPFTTGAPDVDEDIDADDAEDERILQEFSASALTKSFTPLHVACALGPRPLCQALVESGADVNASCLLGTPLFCATAISALLPPSANKYAFKFRERRGTFDRNYEGSGVGQAVFEGLDEGKAVPADEGDSQRRDLMTSLHHFDHQRPETFQMLLDHGAIPLNGSGSGGLMLFQAALYTSHALKNMGMVKSLVAAGVTLTPSDLQQFGLASKRKWSIANPAEAAKIMSDLGSFITFLKDESVSSKSAAQLYPLALDFMTSVNQTATAPGGQQALPEAVKSIMDPFTTAVLAAQYNNNSELETILQQSSIDLNKRVNSQGQTILHIAVQNGSLDSCKTLLRHDCSRSTPDFSGILPIWLCTSDLCAGVLRLILEKDPGPMIGKRDSKGNTIWHMAAARNSCEILRVLKDMTPDVQKDLKTRNLRGFTPLGVALHHLCEDAAMLMVEYMPSQVSNWASKTPILHLAARMGSADVIQALVDAGADIRKRAPDGATPLHFLTQTCTVRCVQLLKTLYPDLYEKDQRQRRPVEAFTISIGRINPYDWQKSRALDLIQIFSELMPMEAIGVAPRGNTFWEEFCSALLFKMDDKDRWKHMQNKSWLEAVVVRLMQIGVVDKHEEIKGTPAAPIMVDAILKGNGPVFSYGSAAGLLGVVQMLVQPEDATRYKDEALTSPSLVRYLHSSIRSDSPRVAMILVEMGVNVRMKLRGYSALEVACLGSNTAPVELLRMILDCSDTSSINALNDQIGGLGLIHLVGITLRRRWSFRAKKEHKWAVTRLQLLLEEGANPCLLTANGTSAVAFHVKNRSIQCATTLLDHGADPTHLDAKGYDAIMHAVIRNQVEFLAYIRNMEREHTLTHTIDWKRKVTLVWDRAMVQRATRAIPSYDRMDFLPGIFRSCNALHVASLLGHTKVLEFLLQEQLIDDLNEKAGGGWTAMHFAAYSGSCETIRILHRSGANVSVDASEGTSSEPLAPLDVVPDRDWARPAAQLLRNLASQPGHPAASSAENTEADATPLDFAHEEVGGQPRSVAGSDSDVYSAFSGYNTPASLRSYGSAVGRSRRTQPEDDLPLLPDVILAEHLQPRNRDLRNPWMNRRARSPYANRSRSRSRQSRSRSRNSRNSSPGGNSITIRIRSPRPSETTDSDYSNVSRRRPYHRRITERTIRKNRLQAAIRRSDLFTLERELSLYPSGLDQPMHACSCPPLIYAIRVERTEVVRWLINRGARLDVEPCHRHHPPPYRNKWVATLPFMVAATRSLNGVLDLVLSRYLALVGNPFADGIPSRNPGPWTLFGANPLHGAVWNANYAAIPIIMNHIEQFKRTYRLILQQNLHAVRHSGQDINNVAGILINQRDCSGSAPLHMACSVDGGYLTIEALVERGADVNLQDGNGNTALHLLTRPRRYPVYPDGAIPETYHYLVKHGANLNSQNSAGLSPLGSAILNNNLYLIKFFLDKGANPRLKSFQGSNVTHTAVSSAHNSQQTLINRAVLNLLLHRVPDLDWNEPNYLNAVPMHKLFPNPDFRGLVLHHVLPIDKTPPIVWRVPWAPSVCWEIGDRGFRLLVRAYSRETLCRVLNLHPEDGGWSPMCVAAWYSLVGTMKNLMLLGADVDWEGHETGTPLMTACARGQMRAVRWLMEQGAQVAYVSKRTGKYRSAVKIAVEAGHEEVWKWLLVGRWVEQVRIRDRAEEEREVVGWGGVVKARVVLTGSLARQPWDSSVDWLVKRSEVREELRGRVAHDAELD